MWLEGRLPYIYIHQEELCDIVTMRTSKVQEEPSAPTRFNKLYVDVQLGEMNSHQRLAVLPSLLDHHHYIWLRIENEGAVVVVIIIIIIAVPLEHYTH